MQNNKFKLSICFLLLVVLFSTWRLSAQYDKEVLEKYAEKYKKYDAVIKESNTVVTFSYNKSSKAITVTQESSYQIVALKPNSEVALGIFYDEHSKVEKVRSVGMTNYDKVCGDYHPEGVFHSDLKLCSYVLNFDAAGKYKNFMFVKEYDDIHFFSTLYFSQKYPVLKSNIKFIIPKGLNLDIKEFNVDGYSFKSSQASDDGEKTYIFSCENLPGYEREHSMPDNDFIYPHLVVVPKSYKNDDVNLSIFGSIADFYHWCNQYAQKTTITGPQIKSQTEKIIQDKKSDIEKIKAIYYWVQDNIRYIAFEEGLAGYIPESAEQVLTKKYGDCKGMANLLKAMLKMAGYDARLTWIGTYSVRYDFSTPSLVACNHMVCTLLLGGKHYVLDATDSYNPFGVYPEHLQGRQALIENGTSYLLDTIPFVPIENNLVLSKHTYNISGEQLVGSLSINLNGEMKSSILNNLNNGKTDDREKVLEKLISRDEPNVKASKVTVSDIQNREEPLLLQGDVSVKGHITSFDNELYVTPDPFSEYIDMTTTDERVSPLYFSGRNNRKTEVLLNIPSDYSISKIPANFSTSTDLFSFEISYKPIGNNKVLYTKQLKTFVHLMPRKRLDEWNNALKQLKKAYFQPIVLKKK